MGGGGARRREGGQARPPPPALTVTSDYPRRRGGRGAGAWAKPASEAGVPACGVADASCPGRLSARIGRGVGCGEAQGILHC